MRILALDQASRISGWAVFDGDQLIEYGKIDLGNIADVGVRLHKLRQNVQSMIQQYNIDKVILEDIYMDG